MGRIKTDFRSRRRRHLSGLWVDQSLAQELDRIGDIHYKSMKKSSRDRSYIVARKLHSRLFQPNLNTLVRQKLARASYFCHFLVIVVSRVPRKAEL